MTAQASDQGPGSSLYLQGSSLHGDPQCNRTSNPARTATSVAPGTPTACQPGTSTDREDGVANGAGPWRCTAGVTPASTRTRDRRTEARTGPGPPAWQATTRKELADDTRCWPPRRPADGPQRARPPREGDGTRSGGLISPSRRIFSMAPEGWGLIPLVPTRFTEVRISSLVSTPVPAGKRPPEDARWRSSPHKKSSPAAQRTGGHRRVTTRKTTGDLATRRGGGDPKRELSG